MKTNVLHKTFFIVAIAVLLVSFSIMSYAAIPPQGFEHVNDVSDFTESTYSTTKAKAGLPSKYDLRDYNRVSPVKNQGEYGCCWAFAAIAAAESSIMTHKTAGLTNPDLSELHLVYYSYSRNPDPLNNTSGDYVKLYESAPDFLDAGGSLYGATFTLAKWVGAADEKLLPYTLANKNMIADAQYEYNDIVHLESAEWISMDNRNAVKQSVVSNGAVAVSYYSNNAYYNASTYSYYCDVADNQPSDNNHAAAVVGWDDNYSAKNFNSSGKLPKSDGAWLVKNSYSTSFGDNGYMWMSYEDGSLSGTTGVSFTFASADNYENNYQYDGGQSFSYYKSENSAYMANVFTSKSDELLKAVSFYTTDSNEKYDVSVYTQLRAGASPTQGYYEASARINGTFSSAGYHTVKLPCDVALDSGENFSVVVRLSNYGGDVKLLSDSTVNMGEGTYNITSSKPGQSFISSDGSQWNDIRYIGANENLRIKAFTDSGSISPTSVALNKSAASIVKGGRIRLFTSITPENTTKRIMWSSSDSSVATVSQNGLVSATSYGRCVITAKAAYGSKSDSCTVTVLPAAVTGVRCTNVDDYSFTLNWNRVDGASLYQIYRYDDSLGKYVIFKTVRALSCDIDGLSQCQRVKYRVRAGTQVNSNGYYGALSDVCYASTVKSMGSALKLINSGDRSVTLKWSPAYGATGYRIYMYSGTPLGIKLVKITASDSCEVTGLLPNMKYLFRVTAYVKTGNAVYIGKPSDYLTAYTRPRQPKNLVQKASSVSSVILSWDKADATGYIVYRYSSNGWIQVGNVKKSECTIKGLARSSQYILRVRAYYVHDNGLKIYGALSTPFRVYTR